MTATAAHRNNMFFRRRNPSIGVWRRLVNLKIDKVEGLLAQGQPARPEDALYVDYLLSRARQFVRAPGTFRSWWSGAQCDQAWRTVHEAEAQAVAMLPPERRVARMREVLFDAASILDARDPLMELKPDDTEADRSPAKARELVARYRQQWDDRYSRSHSYRNRLLVMLATITVFLIVIVLAGYAGLITITEGEGGFSLARPAWSWQLPQLAQLVAIGTIGAVGGLLAGARQVTETGGVYNPFLLPMHSLFLKIQMGALCGLVGIFVLLGGLASEVKVDAWAEVAVWALVFGAAQQLLTQLVDRKVTALVSSEPRAPALKK